LTEGQPALTDLIPAAGFTREKVLQLAASAEIRSEHPIAEAIVNAARAEGLELLPLDHFAASAGYGITASANGQQLLIGADRLLTRENIAIDAFATEAERMGNEGKSPLYVAIDGRAAAVLAVSDPIR